MKHELKLELIKLDLNEHQVSTILGADIDHRLLLENIRSGTETKESVMELVIYINFRKLDHDIREVIANTGWAVMGVYGEDGFGYTVGLHEKCGIELLGDAQVSIESQQRVLNRISELLLSGVELMYDKVVNLKNCPIVTGYSIDGDEITEPLKVVMVEEGPLDYDRLPLNYISRIYPDATPNVVRVYIADELNILPLQATDHVETKRKENLNG